MEVIQFPIFRNKKYKILSLSVCFVERKRCLPWTRFKNGNGSDGLSLPSKCASIKADIFVCIFRVLKSKIPVMLLLKSRVLDV